MSLLILRNLLKTFGGLVAMNSVTFSVDEASIVGLIGPNGAGKTTTFNIITGNYRPDSGEVIFDRKDITGRPTHKIVELGIARTFQNIRLFQDMSVLENVLAGCHCRMRAGLFPSLFRTPAQRSEERQAVERAMRELAFVGLDDQYANLAGNLAYGNQRLLEIARALASEPRFLILDEPAGGIRSGNGGSHAAHQGHPEAGHYHPADRARHEPCHARLRKDRRAGKRGPHRRRHFRRDQEKPEGHRGLPRRGRLGAVDAAEGTSCFPGVCIF